MLITSFVTRGLKLFRDCVDLIPCGHSSKELGRVQRGWLSVNQLVLPEAGGGLGCLQESGMGPGGERWEGS